MVSGFSGKECNKRFFWFLTNTFFGQFGYGHNIQNEAIWSENKIDLTNMFDMRAKTLADFPLYFLGISIWTYKKGKPPGLSVLKMANVVWKLKCK